jgi:hypothetical protein
LRAVVRCRCFCESDRLLLTVTLGGLVSLLVEV